MIYYLFFFLDCFLIEYFKKRNKQLSVICIVALFGFLCFGYMTGSDWREYEVYYTGEAESSHATKGDFGYVLLSQFFYKFIPDFWLFSALFKIVYLWSFVKFINIFHDKPYVVVGFAFAGSLLFMLIDCPFRFMIAMSSVLIGLSILLNKKFKKKRIISIPFFLIAPTIHMAVLFVILIFFTFPLAKFISKTNRFFLFAAYLVMLFVAFETPIFTYIFENVIPIFGTDRYENYEEADTLHLMNIGTLKYAVLLLIILYFRDIIIQKEKGNMVYYFAVLSIILQPLLMCIPTAFRINILSDSFMWIALAYIYTVPYKSKVRAVIRVGLILFCMVFISKDCITNWRYTPYSNSITHIIMDNHLPYSVRNSYNPIHHDDEFWH